MAVPASTAPASTVPASTVPALPASFVHAPPAAGARDEAQVLEALVQSMPVAIYTYDLDGRCTANRGQALSSLGLADDELVGVLLPERFAAAGALIDDLWATLAGRATVTTREVAGRTWNCEGRPLLDGTGAVVGGMAIAVDVTELRRAEQELRVNERRLRALLGHATDVVALLDETGRLLFVSPAAARHFGYGEHELLDGSAQLLNHPEDRSLIEAAWRKALSTPGGTAEVECRVRHADGSWRWAQHYYTNQLEDPAVAGMVVNLRDSTERRRAAEELRRSSLEDPLTGLANRALLLDRMTQAFARGTREARPCGVVVLDVVGMRQINEQFGDAGGDQVLRAVAERLSAVTRPTDSVARVGADEFAVLFEAAASAEELRSWTAVLLDAAQEPVQLDEVEVAVRLRAGFALTPAADAGALLFAAERAALEGTPSSRVGQAVIGADEVEDAEAIADLARALEAGELVLHYQPILRLSSDEMTGVEALVRWVHPDRGLLSPEDFVPLAEGCGLIAPLGEQVLREACRAAAAWRAAGRTWTVSVNLSPRQLAAEGFVELVTAVLAETGAAADSIILEVTESALIDDSSALSRLCELRALGFRLALDDFGTGYSSLTYLKLFPVDSLKIDRSFVAGLGRDADDDAIVASVVSLGRAVGKVVVAEGVETPAQLRALVALRVDAAQGFLWSRALPLPELERWADAWQPSSSRPAAVTALSGPAPEELATDSDRERIAELHREGASLHTIAAALNAEGRRTPLGRRWHTRSVARVVAALPVSG
jgi:diguanylate cyclase (GGDEF)-like protein/PAS domain S-box-containing protein